MTAKLTLGSSSSFGKRCSVKNLSTEIKVGLFFLVSLLLLAYFAVKVGTLRLPWKAKGYTIVVYFDNIAGLEEKAPVRLAGVRIGTVQKITLENGKAKIVAEINANVKIARESSVNVSQMGVMGERYLEIVNERPFGSEEEIVYLKQGDILHGSAPTSFDQVISVVNSIGHDIKTMTASFKRVLASKEGEERLSSILANVDKISDEIATLLAANQSNMSQTVENLKLLSESLRVIIDESRDPFGKTMANVEQISGTLAEKAPPLMEKLSELIARINDFLPKEGGDVQKSLRNLEEATSDLKDSLSSVKNITGKIESGEGTLGKLISDDDTHKNLNAALVDLKGTLSEAKNVLGRVGAYETSLGYRAEYLNQSDAYKHFITLRMQPRKDKYYLLEIVDSPLGRITTTTTDTFTSTHSSVTGDEDVTVHQVQTKIEDKFLVNLQIAKEFHALTFRAGLIETHGGFGLDLGLWKKNITLSFDGWDFGRDQYDFHVKLSGRLALYHGIYVMGGWDDVLNPKIDSAFIGAGMLFTDEDFKYLLGLAATTSGSL